MGSGSDAVSSSPLPPSSSGHGQHHVHRTRNLVLVFAVLLVVGVIALIASQFANFMQLDFGTPPNPPAAELRQLLKREQASIATRLGIDPQALDELDCDVTRREEDLGSSSYPCRAIGVGTGRPVLGLVEVTLSKDGPLKVEGVAPLWTAREIEAALEQQRSGIATNLGLNPASVGRIECAIRSNQRIGLTRGLSGLLGCRVFGVGESPPVLKEVTLQITGPEQLMPRRLPVIKPVG